MRTRRPLSRLRNEVFGWRARRVLVCWPKRARTWSSPSSGSFSLVGVYEDGTFANTALIFDRSGEIVGKYRKTHGAIDHYDKAHPPWTRPPTGKSRDWMIRRDPDPGGLPSEYAEGAKLTGPKVAPGVEGAQLERLRKLGYVE